MSKLPPPHHTNYPFSLRVGTLTLVSPTNDNYGAFLQGYALVAALNNIEGVEAQCLAFDPSKTSVPGMWEKARLRYANTPNPVIALCKSVCYVLRYRISHRHKCRTQSPEDQPKDTSVRALRFRQFASQFQDTSVVFRTVSALQKAPVDCVIVGSDWVWYLSQPSAFFADPIIKKPFLSYAASFGILPQSEEELAKVRAFAPRFKNLSCREVEGAKLLQQLGFTCARQDIDPTMLLKSGMGWGGPKSQGKGCTCCLLATQ